MFDNPELLIDQAYDDEPPKQARTYIGASVIGNPCTAYLAFSLRGYPETSPVAKVKRIFRLGHAIEAMVVADLKKAGLTVWEVDGLTGRQFEYTLYGGHVSSHADGQLEEPSGEHRLLEIKSMNDANWSKCKTMGVKLSHPYYYAQCQLLMGMSGITSTRFVAYNKNNSEYLSELLVYDPFAFSALMVRIEQVLAGRAEKIATDPTDWRCKTCFKRGACWDGQTVEKRCATCGHASPTPQGGWHCGKHGTPATALCGDWVRFEPQPRKT